MPDIAVLSISLRSRIKDWKRWHCCICLSEKKQDGRVSIAALSVVSQHFLPHFHFVPQPFLHDGPVSCKTQFLILFQHGHAQCTRHVSKRVVDPFLCITWAILFFYYFSPLMGLIFGITWLKQVGVKCWQVAKDGRKGDRDHVATPAPLYNLHASRLHRKASCILKDSTYPGHELSSGDKVQDNQITHKQTAKQILATDGHCFWQWRATLMTIKSLSLSVSRGTEGCYEKRIRTSFWLWLSMKWKLNKLFILPARQVLYQMTRSRLGTTALHESEIAETSASVIMTFWGQDKQWKEQLLLSVDKWGQLHWTANLWLSRFIRHQESVLITQSVLNLEHLTTEV